MFWVNPTYQRPRQNLATEDAWKRVQKSKCCWFSSRLGVILIGILVIIQAIITTTGFPYWGYYTSFFGDILFAMYGIFGAINYSYFGVRSFFWWLVIDSIWNAIIFIFILASLPNWCNNVAQSNIQWTSNYQNCNSKTFYASVIIAGIIAVLIRLIFAYYVYRFSLLLEDLFWTYIDNSVDYSWGHLYSHPRTLNGRPYVNNVNPNVNPNVPTNTIAPVDSPVAQNV